MYALGYADKQVVLYSVRTRGVVLKFAGKMRNDVEVVEAAMENDPAALQHAGKEAVEAIVGKNGLHLKYASLAMKNNCDVVRAALRNNRDARQFIGKNLLRARLKNKQPPLKNRSSERESSLSLNKAESLSRRAV